MNDFKIQVCTGFKLTFCSTYKIIFAMRQTFWWLHASDGMSELKSRHIVKLLLLSATG